MLLCSFKRISCKISFEICWNLSFFSSVFASGVLFSSFGLHNSVKRSEAKVSPTVGLAKEGKALFAGKWPGKRR